jgi:hypothetical protein
MVDSSTYIQKLDEPSYFNEIKTNITDPTKLKKNEFDKFKTWSNKFKNTLGAKINPNSLRWVDLNHLKLIHLIGITYQSASLRAHIEALANILLAINKTKYKSLVRQLFKTGIDLQKDIQSDNDKSILTNTQNKNYVSFNDLELARNSLKELVITNPNNKKLNFQYLILAFNTLIPPLRLESLNLRIIRVKDDHYIDDSENYLMEIQKGKWVIIINKDKISNKYPSSIFKISKNIRGVTHGSLLNKIITESLDRFPRDFLLTGLTSNQPMHSSTYNTLLFDIFEPKNPTQNLIRKAYINHWHRAKINGSELSEGTLKEIALHMRHSVNTARSNYRKIDIDSD